MVARTILAKIICNVSVIPENVTCDVYRCISLNEIGYQHFGNCSDGSFVYRECTTDVPMSSFDTKIDYTDFSCDWKITSFSNSNDNGHNYLGVILFLLFGYGLSWGIVSICTSNRIVCCWEDRNRYHDINR